jgi:hypothetical protein
MLLNLSLFVSRYMLYDRLFSVLYILMSRKLILLSFSICILNCKFGWMLLNYSGVWFLSVSTLVYFKSTPSYISEYHINLCREYCVCFCVLRIVKIFQLR